MLLNKILRSKRLDIPNLDIVGTFLKENRPVHFGGMSDPFSNKVATATSRELLKILADLEYPTVLSTKKSDELGKDVMLNLLKQFRYLVIQLSFSSPSVFATLTEPNSPSVHDRLDTLRQLAKEGLYTIARLQPLFPGDINEVASELVPSLGEAGVKHVIVEFLKLPLEKRISRISELFRKTGWDGLKFYKEAGALRTGREWVLPVKYKWEYLQPVIEAIHKNGMTYGAGDYGLNHLSDTDCCCGIDQVEGFSNFSRFNIPYVIKKCQEQYLAFKELSKFSVPGKSIRMYMNSQCRGDGESTLLDYLHLKWNRPGTENAPDTFMGVSWGGDYDDDGNCVYIKENGA